MSVAVIGCGRSGTNVMLEILHGSSELLPSNNPENTRLCEGIYGKSYLTKCDTCYFTPKELETTLNRNKDMKIIWSIRDPRDMILSKIKRGQPKSKGGDGSENISDDATPEGCIQDIASMYHCYKYITKAFSDRILLIRLEDVLLNIEEETKKMCDFLNITYEKRMCNFPDRMRNPDKKKRYKTVDKTQISLWKEWKTIYSGFFSENNYPIRELFDSVNLLIKEFGYE